MTGSSVPLPDGAAFCGICPRVSDGRVCRACAGKLGGVQPDTVSAWVSRGHVTDVRYDGRRPMFDPAEIISVAWKLGGRERARQAFLAASLEGSAA